MLSYQKLEQRYRASQKKLFSVRTKLKEMRAKEKRNKYKLKQAKKTLRELKKSESIDSYLKRIDRTLTQLTEHGMQPISSPTPDMTLAKGTPPGITRPKPKPSALTVEVRSNKLFLKRVEESKNW